MIPPPRMSEALAPALAQIASEIEASPSSSGSILDDPMAFAQRWYSDTEIHQHLLNEKAGVIPGEPTPTDIYSPEFARWMAQQYQLAMTKGAMLTIEEYKSNKDYASSG